MDASPKRDQKQLKAQMPDQDDLDSDDIAAIERSEQEIARGEDLDWKDVSERLRREYLKK
jgi:hypothetical protein